MKEEYYLKFFIVIYVKNIIYFCDKIITYRIKIFLFS